MKAHILIFLLVLSSFWVGCHSQKSEPAESAVKASGETVFIETNAPQLAAISVEPVSAQRPTIVTLAGRLTWDEDATVRVFTPFAGIVRNVFVSAGQTISKDAPLCEIQSADFGQALAEARKAENDFRRTERNLNRARELSEHGAAPRKDLEMAEADYENARAERERTAAKLAIYGASASSSGQSFVLPSPLEGCVVERNLNLGQEVRADQMLANAPQFTAPLFVITDPSRLWIQIDATDLDLPHFQQGRHFTFSSRAVPGETFTGRVEVISESIDPATRTIKVRGSVDNLRRLLKAEMFVTVSLPGMQSAEASVPARAVFLKGDKHYVFVEAEAGHFVRREVTVGPEEHDRVLILAGLEPGQRVVTEGCLLLQQSME